jgi:parallel beta-helix repeat protein
VYNSTENNMVGILLSHVNNSLLINNNSSSNEGGIILRYCSNNTIVNNIVTNNSFGIILFRSSNNRISENYVNENYNGEGSIGLIKSHNNTISGNYASDNREGIDLWESHDNLITENTLENNNAGIRISESDNNIISQNNLTSIPRFNGILLGSGNFNLIYLNCLTTFINAKDYGFNNSWDNGIKGNYWDDYRGSDDDNNRIGDVPYEIFFSNGSQDNFPLMNCPLPLTEGDEGIMWYDILTLIGSLALVIVITGFIIQKQRKTRVK